MIGKLKKGFTLIELLIVIAIIGILTVAFLPTLRGGQASARDAARKAALGSIATVISSLTNGNAAGVAGVMTLPTNAAVDKGACLDFTGAGTLAVIITPAVAGVDKLEVAIRTALSRNPDVPTSTPICDKGYYYRAYPTTFPTNFVLATGLEQKANGNLYSATDVKDLATFDTALGATWSAVLTAISDKTAANQRAVYIMTQ
ncbi:type II secretion system protein [Candidatus Peregrinibacteria bacterium]|nr:type II secretion system protein [Candidatus Peregrinibacteria bacterium]